MRIIYYGFISLIACCVSTLALATVQPAIPNLPPSAQPGGALPQLAKPMVPSRPSADEAKIKKEKPKEERAPKTEVLIPVKGFEIVGIKDHPKAGITKKKIKALAEKFRQELIKKAKPVKSHTTGKIQKGLTLAELYKIANLLTLVYRSAGFIFTTVRIPPQTIEKNGIVKLLVVEGKLGSVGAEGNVVYSSRLLTWPFRKLLNEPVRAIDIESALLTMNSYPGYRGYGVFVKGKKSGTTDLVIKTEKDRRIQAVFGADDNGTRLSGRNHTIGNLYLNNLTGGADRLSVMWIQNSRPNRGHYGGFAYNRRIFSPNLEMNFSYGRNSYSLGGAYKALGFYGISNIGTASLKNTFIRTRQTTFSSDLSLSRKQAKTTYGGTDYRRDNLTVLGLGFYLSHLFPKLSGYATTRLSYQHGFDHFLGAMDSHFGPNTTPSSRQDNRGRYAGGYFNSLNLSMSYLQSMFWKQNLLLKFEGQYSPNTLVSLQQFALGGVNNVRGFPTSEYLTDKGIFGTAEWIIPMPIVGEKTLYKKYTWGQVVHFSAFANYGAGWLNHAAESELSFVSLSSFGAGVEINLPHRLLFQLQWAKPFGFSRVKPSDNKSSRLWFNVYLTI